MSKKPRRQLLYSLLLCITALIWGSAFTAQSIGADYVGHFTFLALRSWIAVIMMVLLLLYKRYILKGPSLIPQIRHTRRGGVLCGCFLFTASLCQQIGVSLTTTAKAGFITAMYVVLVPVLASFLGKKVPRRVWSGVGLGVIGLYLLSIAGSFALQPGDAVVLLCAFLFSLQILSVSRYSVRTDPVVLSLLQLFTTASLSTVFMIGREGINIEGIKLASGAILYCGLMSSGIAYTIQIMAQKELDPSVASLIMSLESVFAALTGWIVLHQTLSPRELLGCTLMFMAIVISQLPEKKKPAGQTS